MRTPANSHRFLRCRSWSSWKESAWRHARCHLPSKPYFLGFIRWVTSTLWSVCLDRDEGYVLSLKKHHVFFPIWHPRSEKIPQTDGVEYSRQFNWGFLGTFQWFYVLYKVVLRSSLSWLVTVNLGFIVAISSLESRVNGGYKSTVKWGVPPCAYLNVEVLCHILVGYIYICMYTYFAR